LDIFEFTRGSIPLPPPPSLGNRDTHSEGNEACLREESGVVSPSPHSQYIYIYSFYNFTSEIQDGTISREYKKIPGTVQEP
jgi:hypothetical protein